MQNKKILTISFVFALFLSVIFLAKPVFASIWEWIYSYYPPPNCCHANATSTVRWQVATSGGNWYEYRTYYYGTSTLASQTPTIWNEFRQDDGTYNCRKEGYIDGIGPEDACEIKIPTFSPSSVSYLWLRVTTNYSGCGTWTPTPSNDCGDSITDTWTYYNP